MKTMNTPTLRFKEFSGAWEVKKVGDVCDCIVPGRNKPIEFNGDIPWITTPDIEQNGLVVRSKKNLNITLEEAKNVGSKIVPKNSIVISCVGELGLVAITGVDLIINQQLHAFIPKESVYFKFLLYALTIQKPYMEKVATKTALPYMNKDNCNSIPVFLPTLTEQTKIANFLTAIDEKIAQLSQTAQLLTDYKKGVMQQIFSQQLRFKDDDGREFAEWEEKSLGKIAVNHYQGINTTADNVQYEKTGIPIIQAKHITNEFLDFSDTRKVNLVEYRKYKEKYNPKIFDLLISNIGTLGKIVLIDEDVDFLIAWNIFKVTLNLDICDPAYIKHYLKQIALEGFFESIKTGNATKFINKSEMLAINIIFPSLLEQTKIANFLTAINDKINNNQTQLDAMKQYKAGLLQQMFV
jgi:type I restriction enzyme S subunit